MKFSHAWLAEYVAIEEPPEGVGARLTAAGIPLDSIERAGGDTLYDFDVFTNRPDCMNHVGLAREYAALTGAALRLPSPALRADAGPTSGVARIAIEAPDLCARYSARAVLGVRVGASPAWLSRRLEVIGQRPINNVVDVTNFVLWELGHPLHAFDLARLADRTILVRRARSGELLTTLDGERRTLQPEMLVIADARRPVALAGVMGGRDSEIDGATVDVLLESAWFDPVAVRRTARALGLRTDAAHRFERGADPEGTIPALDRAAALIAEVAGGRVTGPAEDVVARPAAPRAVPFRPERARHLLGVAVPDDAMRAPLERLGFGVRAAAGRWDVTVPSFRGDVEREVDLIEEIARHRGYDAIPSALPLLPGTSAGEGDRRRLAVARVRSALRAAGLCEAINYAMVDPGEARLFAPDGRPPVAIDNPLQSQASCLRPSLLPGLLGNVAHNLNHGVVACHLFEIGTTFHPAPGRPEERLRAALALAGRGLPAHWSLPRREVDLYDARGAVEQVAELLGVSPVLFSSDRIPGLDEGHGLSVACGGTRLGVAGAVAPGLLARLGIERPVLVAEIDLEALFGLPGAERRYRPLPRVPAVRRDLALVIGQGVAFEAIAAAVRRASRLPIAEVQPFDRYRGPGVPPGCVSLAIQIVFQHPERTLEAAEVQETQDAIVAALERELGARLRGAAEG